MRGVVMAGITRNCLQLASVLIVAACGQSGTGQSNTSTPPASANPPSPDAQLHQLAALHRDCIADLRRSNPPPSGPPGSITIGKGISPSDPRCAYITQQEQQIVRQKYAKISEDDHSISAATFRAEQAALDAEKAGNEQEALRLYKTIDANSSIIVAEAARLSPPGANTVERIRARSIQENAKVRQGESLKDALKHAKTIIAMSDERDGRYAEASTYYQQVLDLEGAPDGDGLAVGERLAFLYANGRGVQKDQAKARRLLSVRDSQRNRTDLALLDRNKLPLSPEDVPDELKKAQIFICDWGELIPGPSVVKINPVLNSFSLEISQYRIPARCTFQWVDGRFGNTLQNIAGLGVACGIIGGLNGDVRQRVIVTDDDARAISFDNEGQEKLTIDLNYHTLILQSSAGAAGPCRRAG